jgi:hypothetical protein
MLLAIFGATQCGLTLHIDESIDVTSSLTQTHRHRGIRVFLAPLSAPFRENCAGMFVIARHDAAIPCPHWRDHRMCEPMARYRPDKAGTYLPGVYTKKQNRQACLENCCFEEYRDARGGFLDKLRLSA